MDVTPDAVSAWVARFAALVPPGEVLDLACGGGRHARHFAALGHPVLALDRDGAALAAAAGPGIVTMLHDLEQGGPWPFAPGRFAGIVVSNYLHRPLMAPLAASLAPLAASLAPGGIVLYQTFSAGNEVFGKPSRPAFLLAAGELLAWAGANGLRVIAFENGCVGTPKAAMVQRLCAAGADFPPPNAALGPV